MLLRQLITLGAAVCALALPALAAAPSPREHLVSAAFSATSKPAALASISAALSSAEVTLARSPGDREAQFQRGMAIGYRGKLKKNLGDVRNAGKIFTSLAASNPRDAEAQLALAGWHLSAVIDLGSMIARTGLGAKKAVGLAALDRALAHGGGRAVFPAVASLTRIQLDTDDVDGARRLAETAVRSRVARAEDRIMQQRAARLLPALRSGNGKAAAALAKTLMPFGRF